jgi:hypothetical protein
LQHAKGIGCEEIARGHSHFEDSNNLNGNDEIIGFY